MNHLFSFFLIMSQPLISEAALFNEYSHLTEHEKDELNSPRQFGSEYESDRLTYQFLTSWNNEWLNNDKVFQYAAGSLGSTRFYTQGRFRFRENLTEKLLFQLSYFELGAYDFIRNSFIFEFIYQYSDFLSLSLYGQPWTLKKDDDIGVAMIFSIERESQIRLYYTLVDFSYNERNEDNSSYEKSPRTLGLVWRKTNSKLKEFYELSVKQDSSIEQRFSNRVYSFGSQNVSFDSRTRLNDDHWIQSEISGIKSFEGDTLNTDNGIVRWEYKTFDTLVQIDRPFSQISLFGLRAHYAQWNSARGNVIHNNLLPHVWWRFWRSESGKELHEAQLGYEFTWHRGQGDSTLRSNMDTNNNLEHRANLKYGFIVSEKAHFNLLLTFDLDDFGSGETWEGGSMQYSFVF